MSERRTEDDSKRLYEEMRGLKDLFIHEQGLNASRYQELRGSVDDVRRNMVTKIEFQSAFEALNQDIGVFSTDSIKLNRRVGLLEKRVTNLEQRGTVPTER